MSGNPLPKLSLLQISVHVADLLLVSEGSVESVRDSRTRFAWHLFFFSVISFLLTQTAFAVIVFVKFPQSTTATLVWRVFSIAGVLWLLGTITFLAYRHYRYLLITKKDLRFSSIGFFFFAEFFLFGVLYRYLYFFSPELFVYANPLVLPTATLSSPGFLSTLQLYDFILYSACTAVSVGYPRIASASALVSFFNFLEVVANLLMIALVVATFVQYTKPKPDA